MKKLKELIRAKLPKDNFVRNASVLVGGTMSAQALIIFSSPILTRLYSPSDFGLLAVYMSMIAISLLISSLRYDIAIPLPEDDEDAANIVALSLILVATICFFVSIMVFYFRDSIAEILGLPILSNYLWMLPLGILLGGIYKIFSQWSVRTKNFGIIASTKVRKSFVLLAIQLSAFKLEGLGLLLGQVASHGVGASRLARPNFKKFSWNGIRKVAIRYQRFPKFSTPAGLARVVGVELPSLILTAAFSPAAAGFYALTKRVLGAPTSLIGEAVSQVFISNAAEAYRNGILGPLVRNLHSKMAQIGAPFTLVLVLLGPQLFGLIFGEDWTQSGYFARWLAPWLYLTFISSPITTVTAVMEKQKQGMLFHFSLLGARILALYTGVLIGDLTTTIIIYAVVNAVWRLALLIWLYIISGNNIFMFLKDSFLAFMIAIISVLPIAFSLMFYSHAWLFGLGFSILLILVLYLRLLKQAY